jgi:hypothetical protein
MSVTPESLRKLATLGLSSEQMSAVLGILADGLEIEQERKKKQAERTRKSRERNVTVTLPSHDSHSDTSARLGPPSHGCLLYTSDPDDDLRDL